MLAGLTNSSTNETVNKISGSNSPQTPSPVPSFMETPNNKHIKKNGNQNLGVILVAAIISPTLFSMLFILIVSGMNEDLAPTSRGVFIFSHLIKGKDLAFLNDHKRVAALQVIGRGGCGEVYRKKIRRGKIKACAIKKITVRGREDVYRHREDQMYSEIRTVGNRGQIHHHNLLPLLAHVSAYPCSYLVYEFMQNGSLHDIIHQVKNGTRELNWPSRLKIPMDVASGLEFLHMTRKPGIVHRDLKPANVLLNDNMEALITDFGLAQSILDHHEDKESRFLAGTFGYMAPEYRESLRFDDKCDIYSFGVILAVLVMGKFPSDEFFQNTSEMSMVRWIRMVLSSDNPKQAIDPTLLGSGYEEQILLVLKMACSCTLDEPQDRPNSTDCELMLTQIIS